MTRKLFWQDPYCTAISTTITDICDDDVKVADTILYAFSGGQESDTGTIDERAVLKAWKTGKDITYTLATTVGLTIGAPVTMQLDWERRYALMRLHFAAEIILALTQRQFQASEKIGAHIAQDKARIDFLLPVSIAPYLPALQAQAQTLVDGDFAIISAFSDEPNERRYWHIDGFARVDCGGTHLKRTGEVGSIELKRKNVGKGKERIEIYVH
jgi:Ser-tRNA(Ala) deacylase AlaX